MARGRGGGGGGGGLINNGGLGGGGGGGAPSLPRRGRGGGGGLPAPGGGGGGGGHNRPRRRRPDRGRMLDHRNGEAEDPAEDPAASTNTGPGSEVFDSKEGGIAGIRGLMTQGGMNLSSGNPYMDSWAAQESENLWNEYDAALVAGNRGTEWTLTNFLNERFGIPDTTGNAYAPSDPFGGPSLGNGIGAGGTPPSLAQSIANYYRQKWNNLSPTARNYFSEGWTGPGRVIAG